MTCFFLYTGEGFGYRGSLLDTEEARFLDTGEDSWIQGKVLERFDERLIVGLFLIFESLHL